MVPPWAARAALVSGMALGLALWAMAMIDRAAAPVGAPLPEGAAAVVNGTVIREEEIARAVGAGAGEPVEAATRDAAVERLIDQELLIQRAYELGMDRSDPTVRDTLLSAMVQSVMASAPAPDTSEASVRAFYEAHAAAFAPAGRVRLRALRFEIEAEENGAAAQDRADAAVARLRLGESFEIVRQELGGALFTPEPDVPLPPSQLVAYLGPGPARAALGLQAGQVSEPIRAGEALYVLKVIERERGEPQPLANVRLEVIGEMHRRAGEAELRRYLEDLRRAGEIRKAEQ